MGQENGTFGGKSPVFDRKKSLLYLHTIFDRKKALSVSENRNIAIEILSADTYWIGKRPVRWAHYTIFDGHSVCRYMFDRNAGYRYMIDRKKALSTCAHYIWSKWCVQVHISSEKELENSVMICLIGKESCIRRTMYRIE